jgi:hypothetical protein
MFSTSMKPAEEAANKKRGYEAGIAAPPLGRESALEL